MSGRTAPDVLLTLVARGSDGLPALPRDTPDGTTRARLLARPALVVRGPSGVREFYDATRVRRRGAVPGLLSDVLFGRGAVHGLDDVEHQVRKDLFTDVLAPGRVDGLLTATAARWHRASAAWKGRERVVVFDEAVQVLGGGVLAWAGLPAGDDALTAARARDLAAIVDGFGSAGPRYLRAVAARRRSERWARAAVRAARGGRLPVRSGSALAGVATHRDAHGDLLDERTAAVELLNVVRPTVAVAWLVTQAAAALAAEPRWGCAVAGADRAGDSSKAADLAVAVAHEVRRRHPFVPALAARVRGDAVVDGVALRRGDRLVLDVVATHRDPADRPDPDRFDPGRFESAGTCPAGDAFVPQGGGDARTGHRCPGEPATVRLLAQAVRVLASVDADLPAQDLHQAARPVPSRPASGVVLTRVRAPAVPVGGAW